jgi:hypothetical protein
MTPRRILGLVFGTAALLSVMSILGRSDEPPRSPDIRRGPEVAQLRQLETLQQNTRIQHEEIYRLTSETRQLSELLVARQSVSPVPRPNPRLSYRTVPRANTAPSPR